MPLQIFGVPGLPEIEPGAELAALILDAATAAGTPPGGYLRFQLRAAARGATMAGGRG